MLAFYRVLPEGQISFPAVPRCRALILYVCRARQDLSLRLLPQTQLMRAPLYYRGDKRCWPLFCRTVSLTLMAATSAAEKRQQRYVLVQYSWHSFAPPPHEYFLPTPCPCILARTSQFPIARSFHLLLRAVTCKKAVDWPGTSRQGIRAGSTCNTNMCTHANR